MTSDYKGYVVSHTHWDREWYKNFQSFRTRLVELFDKLIELLESDPEFKSFTFDGQTVILDDYLAIRPENADRIRRLIADGKLLIGPWFNLPDEFLVSGESLVRNLLLGKKMCDQWGGYMPIGYVPDEFGHTSQLPQIFQGFGIDNVVLFRGITTDQVSSEFTWKGPDGSALFAVKLPDNNAYSNWFYAFQKSFCDPNKPLDPDQVTTEATSVLANSITEKPTTQSLLFMDGCDHVFAQFKTPEIIRIVNERVPNLTVKHSTLAEFIDAVRAADPKLQEVEGELRWSNRMWRFQAVLTNVASSRIHLKQMGHVCETLLERYVEPLCTWNWMLGDDYPTPYINLAWKQLLENSPHDSICGCSIDQVHNDMVYRYDQSRLISTELLKRGLESFTARVDTTGDNTDHTVFAVVFNPPGNARTDVVDFECDIPLNWPLAGIRVTDADGTPVPAALLGSYKYTNLDPTPYDIPSCEERLKTRVAFTADDVPSVGYKTYRLDFLSVPNRQPGSMLIGPDTAENEYITVSIAANGTIHLVQKESSEVFNGLLAYEDGGDVGDGYNYKAPLRDRVITTAASNSTVSIVENSAVRVVFEIASSFTLPATLTLPAGSDASVQSRSSECVECPIKTYVTIAAGVKRVDVKTVFDNRARNHRLRVLLPSDLMVTHSSAESAFDVVERAISVDPCPDWKEPLPTMHPQRSFVDVSDGELGLSVFNKGLPEYEVKNDEARTIALTLLRSTGAGVGLPQEQDGGQLLGEHTFEYSIYAHAGDWQTGNCVKEAHSYVTPFLVGQTTSHAGTMPLESSFVDTGESLTISAIKKAESEDAVLVRAMNLTDESVTASIRVSGAGTYSCADLAECVGERLSAESGTAQTQVGTKGIVTVLAFKE